MKEITKIMVRQWNMKKMDWMGYKTERNNPYSYHHIEKLENGGQQTINNGAVLCEKTSHSYLHLIEAKDLELYVYLNNLLKVINDQQYMPMRRQLLAIDSILKQFEREHCSDRNRKGKILIKEEYTRRVVR